MKIFTSFLLLSLFAISCQEEQINDHNKLSTANQFLNEVFSSGLKASINEFSNSLIHDSDVSILVNHNVLLDAMISEWSLDDRYGLRNFSMDKLNLDALVLSAHNSNTSSRTDSVFSIDLHDYSEILSEYHINLLQPFVDELLNLDDVEGAKTLAENFEQELNFIPMTLEDRLLLTGVSSGVLTIVEFEEADGVQILQTSLHDLQVGDDGFVSSRAEGCSIDWRGVWAGAVVGYFVGGIGGAIVGCAGGTVVLPFIGTVTGCIGGAVFGSTSGFVSGALTGIAANLITTCFR